VMACCLFPANNSINSTSALACAESLIVSFR
jgi:hypothetical protein